MKSIVSRNLREEIEYKAMDNHRSIKFHRRANEFSQEAFSDLVGISVSTLAALELCERPVSDACAHALVMALEVPAIKIWTPHKKPVFRLQPYDVDYSVLNQFMRLWQCERLSDSEF